jgi:hypothetical protein
VAVRTRDGWRLLAMSGSGAQTGTRFGKVAPPARTC